MLVPKLRFKEFNNEWNQKSFEEIFVFLQNNSFSRDYLNYDNETSILNIHYGDILVKFSNILSVEGNPLIPKINSDVNVSKFIESSYLKDGDIIFADTAEDLTVGKAIEIKNIQNNKVLSGLHTIPCRSNIKFAPNYLGFYINSSVFHNQLIPYITGIKVSSISKSNIVKTFISFPSFEEQNKIGKMIELLDKKIELQQKKIEALKMYKKGLIQQLKKDSKNWKEYKLNQLFDITRGEVIPKNSLKDISTNEYQYPVYSSQTSNDGILGYDNKFDFNGKFLTWTTDGANAGKVFFRNGKFRCTNVCGLLYSTKNIQYINLLTADLLNYETPKHVSYVGNPKLMNNVMGDIKIFLPDSNESDRVSNILLIINNKVLLETDKLNKLNKLKKGLMQKMFV